MLTPVALPPSGEVALRHTVLEDVSFWITPGIDGVIFRRDGTVLPESLRFIRPVNAPAERARRREVVAPRAADIVEDFSEAFLAVDPGWPNYFHWLLLHAPLLRAAAAFVDPRVPALLARHEDHLSVPRPVAFARSVLDQSLAGMNPPRPLRFLTPGAYRAQRLHSLNVDSPQRADAIFAPAVWRELQAIAARLHSAPDPAAPRRIFLSRKSAGRRAFSAEQEAALQPVFTQHGIVPVTLEGRSLADQAQLFGGTELIVAPHGSGLANLIFAPAGARVLELNARLRDEPAPRPHFARLAARCGQPYRMLDGTTAGFPPAAVAAELAALLHAAS